MTKNVIKPSIQAALDEAHPTGPGHHPSVRSSLERPDDVFDPNDPDQQGLPLAGAHRNMEELARQRALTDATLYGEGFIQQQAGANINTAYIPLGNALAGQRGEFTETQQAPVDPNDPDQQGLPLAGDIGEAIGHNEAKFDLDEQRKIQDFVKQACTRVVSGVDGVKVTNVPIQDMLATHMDFGAAIRCMEAGNRVQRDGWNGKNMWIAISGLEGPRSVIATNFWSKHASDYAREIGGAALVLPCIIMKTATGEILMGWLASQSDMLAKDWRIVP